MAKKLETLETKGKGQKVLFVRLKRCATEVVLWIFKAMLIKAV